VKPKFHLARHVTSPHETFDVSSELRRACRAVLFQHGGWWTSLYKFSRFYAIAYANPICSVKWNK